MTLGSEFKTSFNPVTKTENKLAEYDGGFAVSFLPYHEQGMGPDSKDGETALIYRGDYFILNGDWTLAYSELVSQGFDACYAFFCSKYTRFGSSWSRRPE